ncbi:orotidine-5'-phosphate decarboxylase [Gilvimarinus sp. SDUM040013]|uniref:Orotidine 5'-phosphate decarboxylase n=1 Tax=Gilvimarinus gilvus TaxID=3058038 RepID=A0ABU4RW18_9GAMM|nr:orotidine-5'-phosphate decarboxylase [Gilvimarinus sp. SDUM040013]MDO3385021.1 orotidine-5'-phosphate decarboxylase [Gilvimarinus sp. SDUM040013]MDX6848396.1 orotidine-5'-phosphate decarboxylase [Gilvimarinus sp. SDUM040013]
MRQEQGPRLLVAMDYSNSEDCLKVAHQLSPSECRLKVGKELFTATGPQLIEQLMTLGFDVFLDLKFHDIPNTTAKAVASAAQLGVWMVNVHASGGLRMMEAAREALVPFQTKPWLIGVTVLTSMSAEDLAQTGVNRSPQEQVLYLADLAKQCGLDGVVCSAQEVPTIKRSCGPEFLTVTPGIRPANSVADDQRRVMTPAEAVAAGSDYLVVGRPVTKAIDPSQACRQILQNMRDV